LAIRADSVCHKLRLLHGFTKWPKIQEYYVDSKPTSGHFSISFFRSGLVICKVPRRIWKSTVICRCINTPVKRQYINAIFEVTLNHRKRVVTDFNFLSFIHNDVKGISFKFGQKIFTGLEMLQLEIWSISFFVLLCSKMLEKCKSVTFMIWHFEVSEYFLTKFEWESLNINMNEWQKDEVSNYPFSIISSHFKNCIYVLSLYCISVYPLADCLESWKIMHQLTAFNLWTYIKVSDQSFEYHILRKIEIS